MELDEMKQAWQQMTGRLDALQASNVKLRTDMQKDKVARSMRRTSLLIWFEAIVNGAGLLLLGTFVARQDALRFTMAALILYPAAIAIFASSVAQLTMLAKLDYGDEVLAIQKKLESLRMLRLRTVQMELLFSLLLWVPLAIVLMRAMFGTDLYSLGTSWLLADIALGTVAIPVLWLLARCFGSAFNRSAFGRFLVDDVTGRGLAEARIRMAALARFAEGQE